MNGIVNYNTMSESILPTHVEEKKKKRFVDWSQPIFTLSGLFGSLGLIVNIIENESLDIVVSTTMVLSSLLAWYRVRKLGKSKAIMDSVEELKQQNGELEEQTNTLKNENDELKESNDQLNALENKLEEDLKNLSELIGIVDIAGKSVEDIQNELINTVKSLKKENDRHHRINQHQAFLLADENRDGKLEGSEIDMLKIVTLDNTVEDFNNDGIITRDEYIKN